MKTRILEKLKNTEGFVSGQEICNEAGVSRTAVWKVINQLKEEGYVIESVSKKGYRIISYPDILSESEIKSTITGSHIIKDVVYYEETDSTNTRAKILGEESINKGTLVVADRQISGKGRRERVFLSPKGEGIYMTLLIKPDIPPIKASMLTIIAAVALREAIEKEAVIEAKIKWPNDIIVNGRKLAGILTEMNAQMDYINYLVIGIGINVNNKKMDDEIKDISTSIYLESKREIKRSSLIKTIVMCFEEYYKKFLNVGDLSFIKEEYNNNLIHYKKEVTIISGSKSENFISLGILDDGELEVEKNGKIQKVISGEVSLRGAEKYV